MHHQLFIQKLMSCFSFVDMMRVGIVPMGVTYNSVLSASGEGNGILLGMQVQKCILESRMR
jgi:hypothetical protein